MKKILSILLVLTMFLSLCACGGTSSSNIRNEKDAVGTYKSVGLFFNDEYYLKENTTFDSLEGAKGTYSVNRKNEIRINAKNEAEDIWRKVGNYFYNTDNNTLTRVFDEDEEYKLHPSFDSNGHSNQSFKAGEGDQFNYMKDFALNLKNDGTYSANYKMLNKHTFSYDIDEKYSGTYRFEKNILWLNFENKEYPMLLVKDKLYFDILEKVE